MLGLEEYASNSIGCDERRLEEMKVSCEHRTAIAKYVVAVTNLLDDTESEEQSYKMAIIEHHSTTN